MKCTHLRKYTLNLVCALSGLTVAIPLTAQTKTISHPRGGFMLARYNPKCELAVSGTVQQVVTERQIGSPPGMHLLIRGPRGMVDAHLGPFLAKDVLAALRDATSVKVVGAMEQLQGHQFLLARQIEFNGRLINIRSGNGFLVRTASAYTSRIANSAKNGSR